MLKSTNIFGVFAFTRRQNKCTEVQLYNVHVSIIAGNTCNKLSLAKLYDIKP